MEIFFSAVLGELATRSIGFFINKYSKAAAQAAEVSLERTLLQAQIIVDEATGRHITNQGMLRQLTMLRDAMYRGLYALDTFRHPPHEADVKARSGHQDLGNSWALSKFNYAKRMCISARSSSSSTQTSDELEEILGGLRTMILDVTELLVFLRTYPRLHRQPYDMHLLLDKCMFGRQMEMQLVINFLLYTQPTCSSSSDLDRFDILPIVGPGNAGKSTLVTHVCDDERVRDHFSQIVFLRHGNFRDEDIAISRDGSSATRNDGRLLFVVDVVGDVDENLWERLCSLSRLRARSGSKIIIASQSDKIRKLGTTTQALTLNHLSHEAYWYFFKVITFGSMDPETHPRLVHLAMEIAKTLHGDLMSANVIASLLRANFNVPFWCKVLKYQRWFEQNRLRDCVLHRNDILMGKSKPMSFGRMERPTEDILVLDRYKTCSSQEEVPNITLQDVVFGSIRPHGIFKVLVWRTRIPPYHSCLYVQDPGDANWSCQEEALSDKIIVLDMVNFVIVAIMSRTCSTFMFLNCVRFVCLLRG